MVWRQALDSMAVDTILTGAQVHGHIVNDTLALANIFCTPVGAVRLSSGGGETCGTCARRRRRLAKLALGET